MSNTPSTGDEQVIASPFRLLTLAAFRSCPTIGTINQAPPHQRSILIANISPFVGSSVVEGQEKGGRGRHGYEK